MWFAIQKQMPDRYTYVTNMNMMWNVYYIQKSQEDVRPLEWLLNGQNLKFHDD